MMGRIHPQTPFLSLSECFSEIFKILPSTFQVFLEFGASLHLNLAFKFLRFASKTQIHEDQNATTNKRDN